MELLLRFEGNNGHVDTPRNATHTVFYFSLSAAHSCGQGRESEDGSHSHTDCSGQSSVSRRYGLEKRL